MLGSFQDLVSLTNKLSAQASPTHAHAWLISGSSQPDKQAFQHKLLQHTAMPGTFQDLVSPTWHTLIHPISSSGLLSPFLWTLLSKNIIHVISIKSRASPNHLHQYLIHVHQYQTTCTTKSRASVPHPRASVPSHVHHQITCISTSSTCISTKSRAPPNHVHQYLIHVHQYQFTCISSTCISTNNAFCATIPFLSGP